jgi:hypothetical protein
LYLYLLLWKTKHFVRRKCPHIDLFTSYTLWLIRDTKRKFQFSSERDTKRKFQFSSQRLLDKH